MVGVDVGKPRFPNPARGFAIADEDDDGGAHIVVDIDEPICTGLSSLCGREKNEVVCGVVIVTARACS